MGMPLRALALSCFFLSGATGLLYQVLWARMLGGVIGIATLMVAFGVGPLLARCLSLVDQIGGVASSDSNHGGG